jgi:hypothetical protein
LRLWRPTFLESSAILDLDQVADRADHALQLWGVWVLGLTADAAQPKRTQRLALRLRGAVRRADLPELDIRH